MASQGRQCACRSCGTREDDSESQMMGLRVNQRRREGERLLETAHLRVQRLNALISLSRRRDVSELSGEGLSAKKGGSNPCQYEVRPRNGYEKRDSLERSDQRVKLLELELLSEILASHRIQLPREVVDFPNHLKIEGEGKKSAKSRVVEGTGSKHSRRAAFIMRLITFRWTGG